SLRDSVSVGVSDVTRGRHSSEGCGPSSASRRSGGTSARKLGDFDQALAHYRGAADRTLSIPEQNYLTAKAVRVAAAGLPRRMITRSPARADSAPAPGIPDSPGGAAP